MAIEIVDLPSYKMVIFHSYVNVYQRVLGWQLDALGPCWDPVGTLLGPCHPKATSKKLSPCLELPETRGSCICIPLDSILPTTELRIVCVLYAKCSVYPLVN